MSDELFHVKESLSPRLAWMRENKIQTQKITHDSYPPHESWQAWVMFTMAAFGDTEDEAIVALAKKLNLKLWNE